MARQGLKFVSELSDLPVSCVVRHQRLAYVKAGHFHFFLPESCVVSGCGLWRAQKPQVCK